MGRSIHNRGNPDSVPWTVRLRDLLVKMQMPVERVVVSGNALHFELEGVGDSPITVQMMPRGEPGDHFMASDAWVYHYQGPRDLPAEERQVLELLVKVLMHLESRLPTDWTAGQDEGAADDPESQADGGFSRRFPFADIEHSVSDGKTRTEVLIRITEKCNQECPFCSAPEVTTPSPSELVKCVSAAAGLFPGLHVALTGGEPTNRAGFLKLLRHCLDLETVSAVQVQTNAVAFSTGNRVKRLPKDGKLSFFVSLHAVDPLIYDRCTGTRGQLQRALKGIRHLLGGGHPVLINAVANSENLAHLPDLVSSIPELFPGLPLPGVHFSILMCPPGRPAAEAFMVRYSEVVEVLEEAIARGEDSGVYVEPLVHSTHASIPLCLVSPRQRESADRRPHLREDETGFEDYSRPWVKANACRDCAATNHCLGVPTPYARRFGLEELKPIQEERPGNRHLVVRLDGTGEQESLGLLKEGPGVAMVTFVAGGAFDEDRAALWIEMAGTNPSLPLLLKAPAGCLGTGFMERVGGFGNAPTVEATLTVGSISDDCETLVTILDAARKQGLKFEYVYPVNRSGLARIGDLVLLAADLEPRIGRQTALVLELSAPEDAAQSGDAPVSIQAMREGIPPEVSCFVGSVIRIRSRIGRPLCLFPDAAQQALLVRGGDHPGFHGEGGFGSQCHGCHLRESCRGVSSSYARQFGTGEFVPFECEDHPDSIRAISWEQKLRWMLVDHPEVRLTLGEIVPDRQIPAIPCTLPWTRLELHDGGTYGPCCSDYMARRADAPPGASPTELWHSDLFTDFRREMVSGRPPGTCRSTCPVLVGGLETPSRLRLRGGPADAVENQILLIRALLEGRTDSGHSPSFLCFPVTSFCNYDCLMCDCGEKGSLDDQRDAAFYRDLEPWLDRHVEIDANGGEPLASPEFRSFVESYSRSGRLPLIDVVTNGSFLTPKWLSGLERVPFRSVIVSLNAATPSTYRTVNRGADWTRIRKNLDGLLKLRRSGRFSGGLVYSMVLLRSNVHEIRPFADLAIGDGAHVRYMLPNRNRNQQSIMTCREDMSVAREALDEIATRLDSLEWDQCALDAHTAARILRERLESGVLDPL